MTIAQIEKASKENKYLGLIFNSGHLMAINSKCKDKKFKLGQVVKHKTANYQAKIKKLYKNGNAILTVIKADSDFGKHIPFDVKANDIKKWFD